MVRGQGIVGNGVASFSPVVPGNAGTHNHRKKFGEDEVFDLRHPAAGRSRGRGVTTGEGTLRRFYPYLICPLGSSYGKAYSYALREGND
ncbi:hypothetical protein TM233_53670 [Bradyrhizobium sp. TM233]|nr:hypothetical protein TM233_53670 [Bradyrhizobium sp. TM233]